MALDHLWLRTDVTIAQHLSTNLQQYEFLQGFFCFALVWLLVWFCSISVTLYRLLGVNFVEDIMSQRQKAGHTYKVWYLTDHEDSRTQDSLWTLPCVHRPTPSYKHTLKRETYIHMNFLNSIQKL